jgi:hypothetical protein
MAIMDAKLELSDAQVITTSSGAATAATNCFQMNSVKNAWGTAITNDIRAGNNELVCNIQVATALNASSYIVAKLYSHTTSSVSSGTALGTATFSAADAAGTRKSIHIPVADTVNKYVGLNYSVVGSNMSTGAVDAWIGLDTEVRTT